VKEWERERERERCWEEEGTIREGFRATDHEEENVISATIKSTGR